MTPERLKQLKEYAATWRDPYYKKAMQEALLHLTLYMAPPMTKEDRITQIESLARGNLALSKKDDQ